LIHLKLNLEKTNFYLKAILSALFLGLAFPKFNFSFFSFFALVPLFFSLNFLSSEKDFSKSKKIILISFLWGIIFFSILLYWLIYTLTRYGYIPFVIACILLILLAFYLSIYYFFLFWLNFKFNIFATPNFIKGIFLAFTWVGTEYLRSKLFTGFSWGQLGNLLANFPTLLQIADLTGIWGLTFVIVLINYYIFFTLKNLLNKNINKSFFINQVFFVLIFMLIFIYGKYSLYYWKKELNNQKTVIKVALLQGNIPQEMKERKEIEYTFKSYSKLFLKSLKDKPDLIFFPETAFPFYFPYDSAPSLKLIELLMKVKNYYPKNNLPNVIIGTFRVSYKNKFPRVYNSLLVWDGENFIDFYDKEKLVPFGEYIPLYKYFSFLKYISVVSNVIKPGKSKNLKIYIKGRNFLITPLICFESAFSNILRKRAKENTQFIYIATNDAWFGKTSAPYQHFQMAIIRAVEARRYVIQVANTGITGIIDPIGKILKKSKLEEATVIKGEIKPLWKESYFIKTGNILGITGAGIFIMGIFIQILFQFHPTYKYFQKKIP